MATPRAPCPGARYSAISILLLSVAMEYPSQVTATTDTPPAVSSTERALCSDLQKRCFVQGKVPYSDGLCYEPLSRGPCLRDEWLTAGSDGEGRCAAQPCPRGRLPVGGRCLDRHHASSRVCGGGAVYLGPNGEPSCGEFSGWALLFEKYVDCTFSLSQLGNEACVGCTHPPLNCTRNDHGECTVPVVTDKPGEKHVR